MNRVFEAFALAAQLSPVAYDWIKQSISPESDGGDHITAPEIAELTERLGNALMQSQGEKYKLHIELERLDE